MSPTHVKNTNGENLEATGEATSRSALQAFMWGHKPEKDYLAERDRLEGILQDLLESEAPVQTIRLEGLAKTWTTGDQTIRRKLLAEMFDGLYIREGKLVRYTPREDR